jgi:hypothetical protein
MYWEREMQPGTLHRNCVCLYCCARKRVSPQKQIHCTKHVPLDCQGCGATTQELQKFAENFLGNEA